MLTEEEENERLHLLELKSNNQRFFSEEEFERLKYLANKKTLNQTSCLQQLVFAVTGH